MAIAPCLGQTLAAAIWLGSGAPSVSSLGTGLAPLAMLGVANLGLLALHASIPFETRSGLQSDLRILVHLACSTPADRRSARASAHVMWIERWLAKGDLDRSRTALTAALAQLGREPTLVRIEERLARVAETPDPVAAARIQACTDPFADSRLDWGRGPRSEGLLGRARRHALGLIPIAALCVVFGGRPLDSLLARTHARWESEARRAAESLDAKRCAAQLPVFERRVATLAVLIDVPRPIQMRQLAERAGLHACLQDFERAVLDQALAVQIAETLRTDASRPNPEAEIAYSSHLRRLAQWQSAKGAYRDALRATGQARKAMDRADREWPDEPSSVDRERARGWMARERVEIDAARSRILTAMNASPR